MPSKNYVNRIVQSFPPAPAPYTTPGYCPRDYIIGTLESYLYTYIYVWVKEGKAFWMYPTYTDSYYISGYIWGENTWIYSEFDWSIIDNIY